MCNNRAKVSMKNFAQSNPSKCMEFCDAEATNLVNVPLHSWHVATSVPQSWWSKHVGLAAPEEGASLQIPWCRNANLCSWRTSICAAHAVCQKAMQSAFCTCGILNARWTWRRRRYWPYPQLSWLLSCFCHDLIPHVTSHFEWTGEWQEWGSTGSCQTSG